MFKILTIDEIHQIAKERDGNCLSTEYVDSTIKLQWECKEGHRWWAMLGNIKYGGWCPKCLYPGRKRLTIKEMRQIAKERDGKCISTKYVDSVTKLQWECKEGHRWLAIPNNIKRGRWCPTCCGRGKTKLTIEEMQEIAERRGGKCLSKEYIGALTKLKWQCENGHIWEATPNAIKRGRWCPTCPPKKEAIMNTKTNQDNPLGIFSKHNNEQQSKRCANWEAEGLVINSADSLALNSFDILYKKQIERTPNRELFREIINRLLIRRNMNAYFALKMQCILGLRRVEVANAKICNIDRFHKRGLFIDATKATKLKHETKPTVKPREQPMPMDFYLELTEFVRDSDRTYILKRTSKGFSDDKPFSTRTISYFYERNQVPWSTHSSRRYYAYCIIDHMRKTKFIQKPLLSTLLGHHGAIVENTTDLYVNPISFEYKRSFIDEVEFYQDVAYGHGSQKTMCEGLANDGPFRILALRYVRGDIGLNEYNEMLTVLADKIKGAPQEDDYSFIRDWISKAITPHTPNELYQCILNDNSFPVHHNNGLDANAVLQLIKESNLDAYSTIINTPGGKLWVGKQLKNNISDLLRNDQIQREKKDV